MTVTNLNPFAFIRNPTRLWRAVYSGHH